MPNEELPFWLVNVPADQRPRECPDFLMGCSEKDKRIIGTPDEEYQVLSWAQVRDIVSMLVCFDTISAMLMCPGPVQRTIGSTNSIVCRVSSDGIDSLRIILRRSMAAS